MLGAVANKMPFTRILRSIFAFLLFGGGRVLSCCSSWHLPKCWDTQYTPVYLHILSVFINSFSFLLKKRTNGCNLVQVFVNIKNKY